jgi:hypothetical protein
MVPNSFTAQTILIHLKEATASDKQTLSWVVSFERKSASRPVISGISETELNQ